MDLKHLLEKVKNSSEYSKLEEASDVVENKGWRRFLGGIAGAIGMGGLSGYLEIATRKRRERKNDEISKKYVLNGGSQ